MIRVFTPKLQVAAADMASGENSMKLEWHTTRLGLDVGEVHS
jgi:hypothetical protein